MTIVRVSNLGKAHVVYRSELQRIGRWIGLPVRPTQENWVLRHVGFSIEPGEAIGVVGENGAGKSTLLKIITGTSRPSEGTVQVAGRIGALLELGMGFNPELTGRQNAAHSAGLMGLSGEQTAELMPGIERFAEIGSYFDEPVRKYSSGMQMRVAFAVATAQRPDLLIVDEALSVGDAYFQHKCVQRIRAHQAEGTSLILVSHDRTAIQSLCDRALLLERGHLLKDGRPEEVLDYYNALTADKEAETIEVESQSAGRMGTRSGTGEARVTAVALHNSDGMPVEHVAVGEHVELRVEAEVFEPLESLVLGYSIKDRLGQVVFGTNTWHTGQVLRSVRPGDRYSFTIAFTANLGVGSYSVQTALVDRDTHMTENYEWHDMALVFEVANADKRFFIGSQWHNPTIAVAGDPQ